jgi:hypothetical protein
LDLLEETLKKRKKKKKNLGNNTLKSSENPQNTRTFAPRPLLRLGPPAAVLVFHDVIRRTPAATGMRPYD